VKILSVRSIWIFILLLVHAAPGFTGEEFSPSDGRGTAAVRPSGKFLAGSRGTWKIAYTTDKNGIAAGGGIVLQISPWWGWTPPQARSPSRPGYVTAEVTKGNAGVEVIETSVPWAVVIKVKEVSLKGGDTITITYGDTGGGKHPAASSRIDRYSERGAAFYLKVDGDGDGRFKLLKRNPVIDIIPGPAAKLSLVATSVVAPGEEGSLFLSALDPANNRVEGYRGTLSLTSAPPGLELPATCLLTKGDGGSKRITYKAGSPGIFRVEAVDHDSGLRGRSNPVEVVSRPGPYRLFWADLHGHSGFSDGTGLPRDYYRYARDVSGLDIAALTDHDAFGIPLLDENPQMWEEIRGVTNSFYRPGRFVTFVGYEWTNWTYGHMHVLFRGEKGTIYSSRSENSDNPEKLWAVLPKGGAITIPHHPGGGPINTDWNFYNPAFEPLVEICSVHGVSERSDGPLAIYHPVKGAFVQDALKRGYRLGFLGGGDGHIGHPGMPYADAPSFGLSGIYAKDLTREGIWEALFSRRTYATTGARIILRFTVNGTVMGEEIEAVPPLEVEAGAVVCGPIKSFDLVRNNRVIHSVRSDRMDYTYSGPVERGDYFYVRVLQENSQQAFSSPVWVK